ncbi:T9SS type A sorting domain-containing protein [Lewinella sp. LCG006]|uniref:T9SS type A sorting domain-containing protein n=1 Tax=Lewinella sp. LCG006 TaxID=3231911 RepID=UPI003460BF61
MKKTFHFLLFLCAFSIQAQEINLTIGEYLYNNVVDVIPLETGGWLAVADVSDLDNGFRVRPRLLRISPQNTIEWSVTLPPGSYDYSTVALLYDSLLQQCYLIHRRNECDLIGPDVIYAFDTEGNLLWTDSPEAEFIISLDNSAATIAMVPGEGLFLLRDGSFSAPVLIFKDASGTTVREYPIDGAVFSGVYYWRPDTLLLTLENRLLYTAYTDDSLHVFAEQILTDDDIQTLHVLNDSVIYSQFYNRITRYDYLIDNSNFLADTTVEVPPAGIIYNLSFDENAMFAVREQSVFTYTHDLRERTEYQLNIPGTQLFGVASDNQDLVVYGNTEIAGNNGFYTREGFAYSISGEPLLNRDLELTHISSTGVIREESPFGGYISTFDSIQATVYNGGMDTVSSLHVKIQKRSSSFICPGFRGLNESFSNLQLLPGDSISLFLGSLTGYNFLNNTLCAWVGTEASPLETDFSNNTSCTEVDIINALETPSSVSSLRVYPNPTSDFLYFNNTDQWQYYQLFDARGVLVQQAPLPKGEATTQLDLNDLPGGVYHLILDGREGRTQARVVKVQLK